MWAIPFIFAALLASYATHSFDTYQADIEKAEVQAAQTALEAENKKLKDKAAATIGDWAAGFDEGRKQGRVVVQKAEAIGVQNVASNPVVFAPQCVLPDPVLQHLNATRSGVRPAPDPAGTPPGVPAAGGAKGR